MSVHKKLMQARLLLQNTKLEKTGLNKFAGFKYFELYDFLPSIQKIMQEVGLCGVVSFTADIATLTIVDIEDATQSIVITSPMGSAALKGVHEVQNIGAVETYQRRYLWVAAFEIVEHDALDAVAGKNRAPLIKPMPDIKLTAELDEMINSAASQIIDLFNADDVIGAYEICEQITEQEEKLFLWSKLPSNVRTAIKNYAAHVKAEQLNLNKKKGEK
jgi:hypothetical protein